MTQVNTVRGPVDSSELGTTLIHEHICTRTPGIADNWPDRFDRNWAVSEAVKQLQEAGQAGIGTIVDLTTPDMGRDVRLMKEVADQVDVHVVCSTGIYHDQPRYWRSRDADDMARAFVCDIQDGVAGSGIKVGAIKVATDTEGAPDVGEIIPFQEKCLRAVARAHRATGVPIITHNGPPTTARGQQRILQEEGIRLDGNVVIGHVGDTEDVEFLKELMRRGGFLGMDRFGLYSRWSMEVRVNTVAKLCKDGYAAQLTLSHDANCFLDWVADFHTMQKNNPTWRIPHIAQEVLPALRSAGVSDNQINQMMVENPKRLLEPTSPY